MENRTYMLKRPLTPEEEKLTGLTVGRRSKIANFPAIVLSILAIIASLVLYNQHLKAQDSKRKNELHAKTSTPPRVGVF